MILLMLISIIQICFLPGFLLYYIYFRKSEINNLFLAPVLSFALSLVFNYLLVFILAYFQLYTIYPIIIVFILESILLTLIFFTDRRFFSLNNLKKAYFQFIDDFKSLYRNSNFQSKLNIFIIIISSILLCYLIFSFFTNLGKIFQAWDAVVSWNRWAVDFFNNKLPNDYWHYPQLLPANWSITYVLMGYPFQYIARGIMPLFLIFMLYILLLNGIKQNSFIFLLAPVFLYMALTHQIWTDGYADVPQTFFSFLSIFCLILAKDIKNESNAWNYIILGGITACGAAVTKQAGIFILILYPILAYLFTKEAVNWSFRKYIQYMLYYIFLILAIVLPFYIYTEIRIHNGLNSSEVQLLTNDIHNGASYFQRILHAGYLLSNIFNNRIIFFLLVPFWLLSFTDKFYRTIAITITLPFGILWALFFSYDIRNACLIFPFYCLGISAGFNYILQNKFILFYKRCYLAWKNSYIAKIISIAIFIAIITSGFVILNNLITFKKLYNKHLQQEKKLGDKGLNEKLYEYYEKQKIDKYIITDYQYLGYLPNLEKYYKLLFFISFTPPYDTLNDKNIGYILLTPYNINNLNKQNLIKYLNEMIKKGTFQEIFNFNDFRLIKIR